MADPEPGLGTRRVLHIRPALAGRRLDQALAELMPEFSRGRVQQWIAQGRIRVDGAPCRQTDKVWGGEQVQVDAVLEPRQECAPQAIDLEIVHEDQDLLLVNKPAGLVVHPAAGHRDGTLQNALLHHAPGLEGLPRSGIVHRLDKDTSGLLVVAKSPLAHRSLVAQLQQRTLRREYRALVEGRVIAGGRVDRPIGRHPLHRKRMAVVAGGQSAVTHYQVIERFVAHTLLSVSLETGRTHQIRVHMASVRHPIVGDPTYGGRARPAPGISASLRTAMLGFPRQALHAIRLGLDHPRTGRPRSWEVPMATDIRDLLELLRAEGRNGAD